MTGRTENGVNESQRVFRPGVAPAGKEKIMAENEVCVSTPDYQDMIEREKALHKIEMDLSQALTVWVGAVRSLKLNDRFSVPELIGVLFLSMQDRAKTIEKLIEAMEAAVLFR